MENLAASVAPPKRVSAKAEAITSTLTALTQALERLEDTVNSMVGDKGSDISKTIPEEVRSIGEITNGLPDTFNSISSQLDVVNQKLQDVFM